MSVSKEQMTVIPVPPVLIRLAATLVNAMLASLVTDLIAWISMNATLTITVTRTTVFVSTLTAHTNALVKPVTVVMARFVQISMSVKPDLIIVHGTRSARIVWVVLNVVVGAMWLCGRFL